MDATITKIKNNIVEITGNNEKNIEVNLYDMSFRPHVGQNVKIFQEGNSTYIINNTIENRETQLEEEMPKSDIEQEESTENVQYVYAQPLPLYDAFGRKRINKVAYCLLAFFLGSIGIHKFYSGKVGIGIVYILFCWTFIPTIASFVEAIIGITKQADAYGNIYV